MERAQTQFQQLEGWENTSYAGNAWGGAPKSRTAVNSTFANLQPPQQPQLQPADLATPASGATFLSGLGSEAKKVTDALQGQSSFIAEADTTERLFTNSFGDMLGASPNHAQALLNLIFQAGVNQSNNNNNNSDSNKQTGISPQEYQHLLAQLSGLLNGHNNNQTNHNGIPHDTCPINGVMSSDHQCHHPLRVLLVRHGEAEGNVDRTVFNRVPDHAIPLTDAGREMAHRTGRAIGKYLRDTFGTHDDAGHHIRMMVSPFLRTRQTAECILDGIRNAQLEQWEQEKEADRVEADDRKFQHEQERLQRGEDAVVEQGNHNHDDDKTKSNSASPPPFWVDSIRESPFLAEQDFGAMEGTGEMAQSKYKDEVERMKLQRNFLGTFWARAPHGESFFQVCNRLVGVISDIVTSAKTSFTTSARAQPVRTVIIVTHGVTLRSFCSVWCHYSPEWLATSQNPPNCAVRLLCGSRDCGYIHGGWEGAADLEKHPEGLPVASINVGTDAARETWSNVLTRIRDRSETLEVVEEKTGEDGSKSHSGSASTPLSNNSIANSSFAATSGGGRMVPSIANSWIKTNKNQ